MKIQLCLILWFIQSLRYSLGIEEKCTGHRGYFMKRNFYVGEYDLPIKIGVSQRKSHQLVSHIAHILLTEALGYQHVNLVPYEESSTLNTLEEMSSCNASLFCSSKEAVTGPEVMMDLELWLSPAFNLERWITTQRIEDCGPLGPIGRAGWFIDERVVDQFWERNGTVIDHYRAFLNQAVTATFDLSSNTKIKSTTEEICREFDEPEKYGCGKDGFYRPPQCLNPNNICATILSDYPQSTFSNLKEVILRYGLLVNIAWLGDEFDDILQTFIAGTVNSGNVLFYHRKPMMFSKTINITHVAFPDCEDNWRQCESDVNQLQKVIWKEITRSAPLVYQTIRAMSFTQDQYKKLLNEYYKGYHNKRAKYREVACTWVKDNEYVWTKWIPIAVENKTTLYIGGIFPITGVYWKQNSVLEAAKMAAKAINKNTTLLVDYDLEILEADGGCATDEVMKSFINYVKNDTYKKTVGILGPACSDTVEPIAGVANHFSTIIISYSAEGTLFNEDKYRFFFRTIPENNLFKYVFIKLFKKLKYTRIAALTEEGQKYPEYLSYLHEMMKSNQMDFIENRKFPRERAFANMSMYLDDLHNKDARIIIGEFYDYAARSVMCTAYKKHMTAANGYLWFLPSWYPTDWYDTDKLNSKNNTAEQVPCTTEEMINAINGHISLSYKFYADSDRVMQENITVKDWMDNYKQNARKEKKIPSSYGGYAYDAVWVYALAINKLFHENESHVATLHSMRTSRRFVEILRETRFEGVTGPLYFQNGSRISDVMLWQWMNESYHLIGIYRASSPDDGELELNETQITWLTRNGQKPDDGSRAFPFPESENCIVEDLRVFLGESVSCDFAKIMANVFGISSFVVIVVIFIVVYKRRYDRRMKNTEKRMKQLGLFPDKSYSLDDWEVPRDRIVINRKLGEGAFGTVYGGEALKENVGWVAVAVKTLKRGSKNEDKLDFLGEAEVMKQFNHVNIVKLIGVCTTEEPVYTVMEFMLYGDLKTYLLSRRHMASEKDRTYNEEVSDRRLTNMALDIARGLSYLANEKYVHRDLACRNCLVNASRSVKIADFGMCRAMYDHDYYRYSKKGMLPIRWMAPESLIDGIFSPMSDVWSYGVVLYEIITFASYPYQGYSQHQVLTHVKNYKTLPVPKGCKPQLEVLLRQCWSSKAHERPQAAAIVEILAQDPELITPCLDVPATSIDLDTDNLDLNGYERARGQSFSSVWQTRKNAVQVDPVNQSRPSIIDASQIFQAGLESVQTTKRSSGFKHPHKKSFHESFKKVKRDLRKERTVEFLPQSTYL